jgi:hypothetical protein
MNPMLQPTGVVAEERRHCYRLAHRNWRPFRNRNVTQRAELESQKGSKGQLQDLEELRFQILLQGKRQRNLGPEKTLRKVTGDMIRNVVTLDKGIKTQVMTLLQETTWRQILLM